MQVIFLHIYQVSTSLTVNILLIKSRGLIGKQVHGNEMYKG